MAGGPIYVVALGASTPVGRNAWSTAAAVRAGISGFTQHPFMIDTAGEPMRAAIAPWLDIGITGIERFKALLFPAIDQVLAPVAEIRSPQPRMALSLGLPSQRPGLAKDFQASLISPLSVKYCDTFAAVASFPNGHAAGLLALEAAAKQILRGKFDGCVVAGVDSYLEPETLEWLEDCDQLHGAGPFNNAWGFIPGEAAGTVLIVNHEFVERLKLTPLARLIGIGSAFEPKNIKTETVCTGKGLTQALRTTLEGLPEGIKVTDIYCDLNGEPYRADEYGFAMARVGDAFENTSDMITAADCTGDLGAASSTLHISLAAIAALKGYAAGKYAIIHSSSEGGERSATLLHFA